MGPLLLARMLELNDTQEGVLSIAFKLADDEGLLLLDFKDLRAVLNHVGERAEELRAEYGQVSKASIGTIQRRLLVLEQAGAEHFFGEPALALSDLMLATPEGRGAVNVLAADKLVHSPRLYATFLLWLLSELFEQLPEVGDPDKPKLVFFFDEAHMLFRDAPRALVDKVETVVRLIRSKGVGVYFVTQNPLDLPLPVLGQLGNRVQHALRAFTPMDQKAVRSAAETFRPNPKLRVADAITQLGVGEALVSTLAADGTPTVVERARIAPPRGRIGPLTGEERKAALARSPVGRPLRHPARPRLGLRSPGRPRHDHGRGRGPAGPAPTRGGNPWGGSGAGSGAGGDPWWRGDGAAAFQRPPPCPAIADRPPRPPPRPERRAPRPKARSTTPSTTPWAARWERRRPGQGPAKPGEAMATSMARSLGTAVGRKLGGAVLRGVLGSILKRRLAAGTSRRWKRKTPPSGKPKRASRRAPRRYGRARSGSAASSPASSSRSSPPRRPARAPASACRRSTASSRSRAATSTSRASRDAAPRFSSISRGRPRRRTPPPPLRPRRCPTKRRVARRRPTACPSCKASASRCSWSRTTPTWPPSRVPFFRSWATRRIALAAPPRRWRCSRTARGWTPVFSDIVMPGGMSGIELAAELRASYPRIGLVLASGYSALIAQGGAPEGVETLRKPYRLDELAVALGHALARASAVAELQAAE